MPENLLSHNKSFDPLIRKSPPFAVMNSKIGVDPVRFAIFLKQLRAVLFVLRTRYPCGILLAAF